MSPIPPFDHNRVLPPHLGNPTSRADLSPYDCTIVELCNRFATSAERKEILMGLVSFRLRLNSFGVSDGFQWLDGSFVEDIESQEGRAPKDVDVVTFFKGIPLPNQHQLLQVFPEFGSAYESKQKYKVDHYAVDYGFRPDITVESTRYWIQLFTHNRNGIWKGILKLPLNTPNEDQQALAFLNTLAI
ncbi:hypothetical protein [Chitinophaga sp. HK235]|uniref:DUF6932 family protein n=1 Tax=Chitinophaga sp. HK235 TaxID=2952571 RepID=UPI001BAA32BF|nr:hypothetical protein [Chitinophaga sp. HK235]